MTGTAQRGKARIVVGVDGSESSKATGARLEAVMTWEIPSTAYGFPLPAWPGGYDLGPESQLQLHDILQETQVAFPGLEVVGFVAEGRAGPALVAAAEDADLLVVGTRGHGEVVGAILGSVSEYCVTHAPCPVVVVRHGKDRAEGEVALGAGRSGFSGSGSA